jgi:hypothetical protein
MADKKFFDIRKKYIYIMIKNSDDANKYYQLINQYIDEYVENWNIRPNNLKSYLLGNKSNLLKFLERRGLNDVNNINTVLSDVIEDRVSMYNDSVMTFESFKLLESDEFKILDLRSNIFKGIQKSTIDHEKILADFFDASLSEIDVLNSDQHLFSFGEKKVYVFSKDEISILRANILEHIYQKVKDQKIIIEINSLKIEVSSDVYLKSYEDFDQKMNIDGKVDDYVGAVLNGEYKKDNLENLIIEVM